jgi:hypothetical protein
LLDDAEGEYLNLLGASLGVPRPEVLTDEEQYREFVRALAFSPRGTVFALELVLDALLGDGNWEVFEDFTGFVEQHFATIFIRRTDLDPTDPAGKFFLDGEDRRPITTTTTIALTETPLEVAGVRLADDPTDVRLVAQGLLASSVDGLAITGPAGAFPARVRRGQRFEVLGGPQAGAWGRVLSRTSDTAITLGISAGVSGAGLGAAIRNVPWRIVADYSQFRWNLPSVDTVLEYVGDTGTTLWEWFGASTTEGASVSNATDAALGYYLSIGDPSAGATTAYRHRARIQPESFAAFQLLCAVPGSLGTGSTDGLQVTLQIRDSVRRLAIGWIGDVGGTFARIGFINATTGAFLNATITLYQWTYASPGFRTVEIRKYGRGGVVLLVDGQIVDRAAYASFATGTETELIFGCLSTTQSPVLQVKAADWKISTERDYWNARASAGTMPGGGSRNIAALGGIVQVGDVGRRMRIFSIAALNAGGGNARGE